MQRPEEVNLSREEDEALIERLKGDALIAADRRVLIQVLRIQDEGTSEGQLVMG